MEKVIIVSVDKKERLFIKCFPYKNDFQLEMDVEEVIGKNTTFYVIYREDVDDLETALTDMESWS